MFSMGLIVLLNLMLPLASALLSEPPPLTNTIPTSWITTAGLTIADDAWDWQQFLISDGFSGVPSSEFSTCSSDYVNDFLSWASIHTSNWVTYSTATTTRTVTNVSSTYTTTQTLDYYQPLGDGMGGFSYQYEPPCCGYCNVYAPTVKLYYWQNLTSPNETITSTAIIEDQYTATYPSAFLVFDSVYTEDHCSYNSTFYTNLGYQINTDSMYYMLQGIRTSGIGAGNLGYTALPFNFWDQSSLCSSMVAAGTSSFNYLDTTISNTKYGFMPCYPAISAPDSLFSAVPGWDRCAQRDIWYRGSNDPPHTLTAQPSLAPSTTAAPVSQPSPPAPRTSTTQPDDPPQTTSPPKGPTSVSALPETKPTSTSTTSEEHTTPPLSPSSEPNPTTSIPIGSDPNTSQQSQDTVQNSSNNPNPLSSAPPAPTSVTLLKLSSNTFTLATNSAGSGELAIGSTTISEGGPAATIDGTLVSLGTSALVIGTKTQTWNPSATTASSSAGEGVGGAILSAWTAAGGVATTNVSMPSASTSLIAVGAAESLQDYRNLFSSILGASVACLLVSGFIS